MIKAKIINWGFTQLFYDFTSPDYGGEGKRQKMLQLAFPAVLTSICKHGRVEGAPRSSRSAVCEQAAVRLKRSSLQSGDVPFASLNEQGLCYVTCYVTFLGFVVTQGDRCG